MLQNYDAANDLPDLEEKLYTKSKRVRGWPHSLTRKRRKTFASSNANQPLCSDRNGTSLPENRNRCEKEKQTVYTRRLELPHIRTPTLEHDNPSGVVREFCRLTERSHGTP